ncbi:MAG: flagellar export chaperone FlgN [Chitinivibrionales bacterium]
MEQLLKQLQSLLDRLILLHDQLLRSAGQMNEAVQSRDLEKIHKCTHSYDETTVHIEELEEKRTALCREISMHAKPAGRRLSMQDIIELASPPQQETFSSQHRTLKEKITALTRINTANKVFLEQSLETVTFNVELRFSAANQSCGYKRSGTHETARRPRGMLNRTA